VLIRPVHRSIDGGGLSGLACRSEMDRTSLGTLVVGLLFAATVASAAEPTPDTEQVHWLIGLWEGDLEGVPAPQGRFVEVWAVAPDGPAQGVMGIAGEQNPGATTISVQGSDVHLVNGAKSVIDLRRTGDDRLEGLLVGMAGGRALRLTLIRAGRAASDPSNLGRQFLGKWEGEVAFLDSAYDRSRTLCVFSVNQGDGRWTALGRFGTTGKRLARVAIELDLSGHGHALQFVTGANELVRLDPGFGGKHLYGSIKYPGAEWPPQFTQPALHLKRVQ
jgi:hypothetical protein